MRRVCVVGGGPAGVAAANEATRCGSEVELFESSENLPLPKTEWPSLVQPGRASSPPVRARLESGVSVRLGVRVSSVDTKGRVSSTEGARVFDRIVVATGTQAAELNMPGISKPGCLVLSGPSEYVELRERKDSTSRIVVSGPSLDAAVVADRVRGGGRKVALLLHRGFFPDELGPELSELMRTMALSSGVDVFDDVPQRAAGVDRVEAIIGGGRVVPCDLAAFVPKVVPSVPTAAFLRGPGGGVTLDKMLWSASGGFFASGGCAEVQAGLPGSSLSLSHSSFSSGRTAGANASGMNCVFSLTASRRTTLFGVDVVQEGLVWKDALTSGFEVRRTGLVRDGRGCSIVYERRTKRVLGIGAATPCGSGVAPLFRLIVSKGIDLKTLAELGPEDSTDISLVGEAASKGISMEPRSAW